MFPRLLCVMLVMCRTLVLSCLIKTGRSRVTVCHSRTLGSLIVGTLFIQLFHMGRLVLGRDENSPSEVGMDM